MVTELTDGIVLYHGSYCKVRQADINRCRRYKDFGQGFYLTTDKEQAENFSLLSTRKAAADNLIDPLQNYGIISCFRFQYDDSLKIN